MTVEKHDFAQEFPQHHDRIHQLKEKDAHFRRLFDEYNTVSHEIVRVEQEIETVSDVHAETLKKKRLQLKDELLVLLNKAAA